VVYKKVTDGAIFRQDFIEAIFLALVENFKEHLVERIIGINKNRGGDSRLLQGQHSTEDVISDSRLYSWLNP